MVFSILKAKKLSQSIQQGPLLFHQLLMRFICRSGKLFWCHCMWIIYREVWTWPNIGDNTQEDVLLYECSPFIMHYRAHLIMTCAKWHSLSWAEQVYMLTLVKFLHCFASLHTDNSKKQFSHNIFSCRLASHYPYTLYWLASVADFYVCITFNLQGVYCFNRINSERKILIFQARRCC